MSRGGRLRRPCRVESEKEKVESEVPKHRMKLGRLAKKLTPPAVAWRLERREREADELERFAALYAEFLKPGDLCFDIGANLGNRLRCFRALGCRVVAVEPQASCFARLESEFAADPEVTLVRGAVASSPGERELKTSPDHVLSTLSEDFIRDTRGSGRFAATEWSGREVVECLTMDQLVERHGEPVFVKIDVEGFEPEVLGGMSRAVSALSFEWTPEMPGNALACVERLESLAAHEYTVSWAETMRLSARGWRDAEAIRRLIGEFAGETFLFGDIYARLPRGAKASEESEGFQPSSL